MVGLPGIKHPHLFIEEKSQGLRLAVFNLSLHRHKRDQNACLEKY